LTTIGSKMKFNSWLKVYGDQKYRNKNCPPESAEQITFFNVLRRDYPKLGEIAIHPRNEGKRSIQQTQRQKAEGMTPGASDIIIPGTPTFVCELKRQDHTLCKWEPKQVDYLENCQNNGAFVCVALGYKAALEALKEWMK
jgi:hypothetical protein